jgi:hypothetical protein
MYEIRPESIKTFIEDSNIKLPRFQRKQTWDAAKNFKLCVSIFKEYPIGVSILSLETVDHKTTRWLLDGRQRRNALMQMAEDPENIYLWAKRFIGFKDKHQPQEVEGFFWDKINLYLEQDDLESGNYDEVNVESEDETPPEEPTGDNSQYDSKIISKTKGLELMLNIILMVHNKNKKYSGFSRPFDFTKWISDLPYVENNNGKQILNSRRIKSYIGEYKNYCRLDKKDFESKENFADFLKSRFRPSGSNLDKIIIELTRNWDKILDRIELLDKIDNLLLNSKIGLIEVKNINTADGQKIFNIINSEGTQLTAVEILSAKPNWNRVIKNPNAVLIKESKELYASINIKSDDIVRWDVPATLIPRLKLSSFIFKDFSDNKSSFEKKLTLGFKVLSGLLIGGIKKEDINKLSTVDNINWEVDIDNLINDLNIVIKLLSDYEYFKYFQSWKASVMDILSDTIALNFLVLTYLDWKRKGSPIGSSVQTKQFQKNAVILLDRLIFEYITRQWRGSSDAKFAQNITALATQPVIYTPIEKAKWSNILKDIFDKNMIEDVNINQKILEPILYHFYCLKQLSGPDTGLYSTHIDHIVPQALFKKSALPNKDLIQNNLFNLALLPAKENISKSDDRLIEITNQWLKDQILKYEFIAEKDYLKYSDLNNLEALKKERRKYFEKTFDSDRDNLFNN